MHFKLDEEYLTDITIHKEWGMYDDIPQDKLTPEQLIKILKGEAKCSSIHSEDHPEFNKLRNTLEQQGYIETQRNWWNGDTVLKPFTLNTAKFKKGEQFPSGAAIKYRIESKLTRDV